MNPETSELIALLTQRHQAFRSLASEIAAGQDACVALDFQGIEVHDTQKVRLCAEVRRLDLAITELQRSPSHQDLLRRLTGREDDADDAIDAETLQRIRRLWQDSDAARAETGRRNRVYAEFLRRARSTVNVMTNIMSHCLGVYPPAFEGSAGLSSERGL
ncbi:MAG: hypothetical protein ACRD18_08915 [Terriglobia bacterium]